MLMKHTVQRAGVRSVDYLALDHTTRTVKDIRKSTDFFVTSFSHFNGTGFRIGLRSHP